MFLYGLPTRWPCTPVPIVPIVTWLSPSHQLDSWLQCSPTARGYLYPRCTGRFACRQYRMHHPDLTRIALCIFYRRQYKPQSACVLDKKQQRRNALRVRSVQLKATQRSRETVTVLTASHAKKPAKIAGAAFDASTQQARSSDAATVRTAHLHGGFSWDFPSGECPALHQWTQSGPPPQRTPPSHGQQQMRTVAKRAC